MKDPHPTTGASLAGAPGPVTADAEPVGFPRVYAVVKWAVIVALTLLAIMAAAFWAMLLGGFASSGFRATDPAGQPIETLVITPECAWPYSVNDGNAKAMCRMFNKLTPEERARVVKSRK
jgi:hypothetical protein